MVTWILAGCKAEMKMTVGDLGFLILYAAELCYREGRRLGSGHR